MIDNFWILLLFPLFGAAVNGLIGKKLPARLVGVLGSLTVFLSFAVAAISFVQLLGMSPAERAVTNHLFTWIQAGDFVAQCSFLFDPLSAVMILVVTGVGFLIHLYSIEYMRGEDGYYRFFAYMNLFIFMMSILVLADNYLLMFVGWEGVGLCSYLLIGYYFDTRVAGDAAKKAFIVNRIGDFGFLLGVFLIFQTFGSVSFHEVFTDVVQRFPAPEAGLGVLGAITLLLFLGATGKSAQIPLYVWLPDAMAGPTPVSALIHAATMVTAGVYMIARSAALYSRAPDTMAVVATIGVLTCLLAALIAITQKDIKKVLAYSTVSQLGYMFLAVGVGAFSAGIFHLYTHAFFKALLFLGSGSVILAVHHEQDMYKMGGLKKYLPVTWITMGAATLAIAGIPPFAGFFSKDEILWQALTSPHGQIIFWLIGTAVAALTAFYMARLMFLTFYGPERFELGHHGHGEQGHSGGHEGAKPVEPSWIIKFPLSVLGILSLVGGLVGLPAWLGPNYFEGFLEPSLEFAYRGPLTQEGQGHASEIGLTVLVVTLAIVAIWVAYRYFLADPTRAKQFAERHPALYQAFWNKFYVDEIYDAVIVHPIGRLSESFLWRGIDDGVIDAAVNGVASLFLNWSRRVRKMQTGYARAYASWILFGVVLIFVYYYIVS